MLVAKCTTYKSKLYVRKIFVFVTTKLNRTHAIKSWVDNVIDLALGNLTPPYDGIILRNILFLALSSESFYLHF